MQLRNEYSRIRSQIFIAFQQPFKCFSDECHMLMAHSVFKQSAQNVHQLQQNMIKVCSEMIRLP